MVVPHCGSRRGVTNSSRLTYITDAVKGEDVGGCPSELMRVKPVFYTVSLCLGDEAAQTGWRRQKHAILVQSNLEEIGKDR